jgi:transposase-like protein
MANINLPQFKNEETAREYLEAQRWPNGPICPHCGANGRVYKVGANEKTKIRKGLYHCNDCKQQFTVTVGTVFERSKIPLHKWLAATYLMCSSKKGISAKQIERTFGVTYKTAWFMCHRIREAMKNPTEGKLGGGGHFVEADETYIGSNPIRKKHLLAKHGRLSGGEHKEKVVALVERDGRVRSFHIKRINSQVIGPILKEHISLDSAIMTDEAGIYKAMSLEKHFAGHGTVNHGLHEYVRGINYTNTVEGYFSILKRGMTGIYQHCSRHHLKRYLAEFDFRYSYREKLGYDDIARTNEALKGIKGKRLTYQRTY